MSIPAKIITKNLCFSYENRRILENIDVEFPEHKIIAVTGPSGTGKSTFLSIFNRLWEETGSGKCQGEVYLQLQGSRVDIYGSNFPLTDLRRLVGMVFQTPNPLPMSIAKNITFPILLQEKKSRKELAELVEKQLQRVHLFDEVKDRLESDARTLSGGQQQRLCIARALILEPEILLLDEPTSSLDSGACEKVESLIVELKSQCTMVMVSHYQDQIQRVADKVFEMRVKTLNPIR